MAARERQVRVMSTERRMLAPDSTGPLFIGNYATVSDGEGGAPPPRSLLGSLKTRRVIQWAAGAGRGLVTSTPERVAKAKVPARPLRGALCHPFPASQPDSLTDSLILMYFNYFPHAKGIWFYFHSD